MKAEAAPRIALAILAKAPLAGLAKTRLIPLLGAEGAATLHGWLLQRTVATALAADLGPVTLWCAPQVDHPEFVACRASGALSLRCQPAGDLGERMHAAIAGSGATAGTLVIGTDCPGLTPEFLQQAAAGLLQHEATLIPAEDGGYVLIGMRQADRRAFHAIDWSTERVMEQTRCRLHAMNWRWQELPPLWDVDRPADFVRLASLFPELAGLAARAART